MVSDLICKIKKIGFNNDYSMIHHIDNPYEFLYHNYEDVVIMYYQF